MVLSIVVQTLNYIESVIDKNKTVFLKTNCKESPVSCLYRLLVLIRNPKHEGSLAVYPEFST